MLNKHANTSFLPDKHLLAKRLAQCLTSFLPSGVHLKALETYHLVFTRIGLERLAADLPIYAGGLFPLLSYCSTSLKGPLLSLYESHLLPLGPSLAPILDGLVLAILPGLEDETSEFYGRARSLLDKVAVAVADIGVFSRAVWRALLLSQPVRYAAAHYLRLKLAPNPDLEDSAKSTSTGTNITTVSIVEGDVLNHTKLRAQMVVDMPLVAYAITAALSDTESLIQRNVLDLLLGEVSLDAPFFCSSPSPSQNSNRSTLQLNQKNDAAIALVGGVFVTLLKRDMSLTKRVHTWLLGGKDGEAAVQFCLKYSKQLILAAIDKQIEECLSHQHQYRQKHQRTHHQQQSLTPTGKDVKAVSAATKPCRIAIALIDRPELCECVGRDIARRMLHFGRCAVNSGHTFAAEISNAVADVLQDVGSARVFEDLEQVLAKSSEDTKSDGSKSNEKTYENFELLSFSLSMLPTKDAIVRNKHLPALLQVVVDALDDVSVSNDLRVLDKAVGFCSKAILAMRVSHSHSPFNNEGADTMRKTVAAFASFFVAWLAQAVQAAPPQLRRDYSLIDVADEVSAEVAVAASSESHKETISIAKSACALFVAASASSNVDVGIISVALHATAKCAGAADIRVSLAGARAFADLSSRADSLWTSRKQYGVVYHSEYENSNKPTDGNDDQSNRSDRDVSNIEEQVYGVIRRCWRQMHPSLRTATAQSAQTLLALQSRYPEHVRVVLADGMLSPILQRRVRNLERFACLWRLAVEHRLLPLPADSALFLMLDALTDEHWGPKMLARSWLADALEVDAATIIDAPLRLLLTTEARSVGERHEFSAVYDAPRALYALHTLRSVLESSPSVLGSSLSEHPKVSLPPSAQLARRHKKTHHRGRVGIRALASASPSPRTVQALSTVFAVGHTYSEDVEHLFNDGSEASKANASAVPGREQGPVRLAHLLPAHNYIVVIGLTCLGYLRGCVPERFRAKNNLRSEPKPEDGRDSLYSEDEEDLEWTLAGLGSKSMVEQHEGVSAAAAECLATLLVTIPVPSQMSSILTNLFAQPVLNLITSGILGTAGAGSDPVLQLHFLNAMSFLISADGPCYMSSVYGSQVFSKAHQAPILSTISLSESHSQVQLLQARATPSAVIGGSNTGVGGIVSEAGGGSDLLSRRDVNSGTTESLDSFIPWLFSGIASAALADRDSGSHELLGVRRRWIQLIDTVMKNIGFSLPVIVEGLLMILCQLLEKRQREALAAATALTALSDSEFSRVDETLVLLEGLAVVTSNVLWSFEHALSTGDLKDGTALKDLTTSSSLFPNTVASDTNVPAGGLGTNSGGGNVEHSSSDPSTQMSSSLESKGMVAKSGISSFLMSASNVVTGSRSNITTAGSGIETSGKSYQPPTQAPNLPMQASVSESLSSSSQTGTGTGGGAGSSLTSTSVANTTSSMMNALNPLRMINDFVKDVWTGSAADGTHRALDPRRSGARILFCLTPLILRHVARVWGPPSDFQLDASPTVLAQTENMSDDYAIMGMGNSSTSFAASGSHSFSRSSIGSGSGSGMPNFSAGVGHHGVAGGRDRSTPLSSLPRLSTELPKERRQAQRSLVLSILEPMFEIRPLDVVAGIISIFYHEQDEFGALPSGDKQNGSETDTKSGFTDKKKNVGSVARMACHMLHALDSATVEVVVQCVKIIFEKAIKWDVSVAEAAEGRAQATLRQHAQSAISALVAESVASIGRTEPSNTDRSISALVDLSSVGKMAPNDHTAALPGGTNGVNLSHIATPGVASGGGGLMGAASMGLGIGMGSGSGVGSGALLSGSGVALGGGGVGVGSLGLEGVHKELFHWGDFFARHSAAVVETACINFVDEFVASSGTGDDVSTAWNQLFPLLRDGMTTLRRKASVPAMLRTLGTFVAKVPSPIADRRIKREIMLVATLAISACSPIAAATAEVGVDEHGNALLFKKRLAIVALDALGSAAPLILDAAFLDDRPQLGTTAATCVAPAVSMLKKAAARSAAIAHADTSASTVGMIGSSKRVSTDKDTRNSTGGSTTSAAVAGKQNSAVTVSTTSATGARHDNETTTSAATTTTTKTAVLDAESLVDLATCEAGAALLYNVGTRDWGVKLVRSKMVSLLEDSNWFHGKNEAVLGRLSQVTRDVVANGGASLLLSTLGTWPSGVGGPPGMTIPGLFIGRDSEAALRARAVRRIAYVVFVADPDVYGGQLPLVLERIRDVLRMSEAPLVAQCLFCLRALLLRTGPSSITAFRASVLAEMFRILGQPAQSLPATMSVLRFLDVVTLLAPPEYGYERSFLFGQDDALAVLNGGGGDGGHEGDDQDGDEASNGVSVNGKSTADDDDNNNDANAAAASAATAAATAKEAAGNDMGQKKSRERNRFVPLVARVAETLWKPAREWTVDEVFAAPLRLQVGQLVVGGAAVRDAKVDAALVGRVASALVIRSAMPMMKAGDGDHDAICREFEKEFVYQL